MASWKRDFASGLIILVPLLVTIIVLAWLYSHLTRVPIPIGPLAEAYGLPTEPLQVLLTIIIFVLLVFSVGYLMRTAVGAVVEGAIDDLMNSLPGLRVIYNASKMAVETALGGTELQAPVRLEVWDGLRMTAFKTGNRTSDGREVLFLPTAPNITTGFVIEVEPDRYYEIDDSVEDALTRLLSAGFGESHDENIAELFIDEQSGERPKEVSVDDVTGSDGDQPAEASTSESDVRDDSAVESDGGTPASETE